MREKKRRDPNLIREFQVGRFLWTICGEWAIARKTKGLENFYREGRKIMEKYDKEHPTGRRIDKTSEPATTVPTTTTPATAPTSVQPSTTAVQPPSNAGQQVVIAGHIPPTTGQPATNTTGPPPTTAGHPSTPLAHPPTFSHVTDAERTPPPKAGPSKIKAREPSRSVSVLSDSTTSSYRPGRRIQFLPNETWPAMKKTETKVEQIKKEGARKEEKRVRNPPVSTGVLRRKPCKRCVRIKAECYNQTQGVACLGCARVKMRCDDVTETEQEMAEDDEKVAEMERKIVVKRGKRPARNPPAKVSRPANPSPSSPAITPPPATITSKRRAVSPAPQQPRPKRQVTKKGVAVDKALNDRVDELTIEVKRQRDLIDAILPVYLRLQETLPKTLSEINETVVDLQDAYGQLKERVDAVKETVDDVKETTLDMDELYQEAFHKHLDKINEITVKFRKVHRRIVVLEAKNDDDIQIIDSHRSYQPPTTRRPHMSNRPQKSRRQKMSHRPVTSHRPQISHRLQRPRRPVTSHRPHTWPMQLTRLKTSRRPHLMR